MANKSFVSVDIESDGPIPGDYSMLSIGACLVDDPSKTFYVELRPISLDFDPGALAVSGLDRKQLLATGEQPADAMNAFSNWLSEHHLKDTEPVFYGNNAPFDWMFVCWYLHHFLGCNPFGHSAFDVRSYAMGALSRNWSESSLRKLPAGVGLSDELSHNALDDAVEQAHVFKRIRRYQFARATASPDWSGIDLS